MIDDLIDMVRSVYGEGFVPFHRPVFGGSERQDLVDCIDSNFVSSVGEKVIEMERRVAAFAGASHGVGVVNGTNALRLVGVERDTEVITQALSFVATCNAMAYLGAPPVFCGRGSLNVGTKP